MISQDLNSLVVHTVRQGSDLAHTHTHTRAHTHARTLNKTAALEKKTKLYDNLSLNVNDSMWKLVAHLFP